MQVIKDAVEEWASEPRQARVRKNFLKKTVVVSKITFYGHAIARSGEKEQARKGQRLLNGPRRDHLRC
jgi:hypothetical protein